MRSLRAQIQKGGILSPSSKFARRERISHTEIDPLYVIPAAGGKTLKGKSLKKMKLTVDNGITLVVY